jgi:ABC-type multidrug transport system permease subunit
VRPREQERAGRILARAEGLDLVLHPFVLGGAVLSGTLYLTSLWHQLPILQEEGVATTRSLLPLAAATFLASNLNSLKARRFGFLELFDATPSSRRRRMLAHLGATLAPTALAIAIVVLFTLAAFAVGGVGTVSIGDLVGGPLIVAFAGCAGAALAEATSSPAVAPASLIGAVVLQGVTLLSIVPPEGRSHTPLSWLALWHPVSQTGEPSIELVIRPSGQHAAYLAMLTVLAAVLAMTRHLTRRIATISLVVTALLVVGAVLLQTMTVIRFDTRRLADIVIRPNTFQTCRPVASARYCVYPSYSGLLERWSVAVQGVLDRTPLNSRPHGVQVRQVLDPIGSDVPSTATFAVSNRWQPGGRDQASNIFPERELYVGSRWGRGGEAGKDEFLLALGVAAWATNLPVTMGDLALVPETARQVMRLTPPTDARAVRRSIEERSFGACSSLGQARAVVALWLAGQATPTAAEALGSILRMDPASMDGPSGREALLEGSGLKLDQHLIGNPIFWGEDDATYAVQLLARPDAAVESALSRRWSMYLEPATPTATLVQDLGLTVLPTLTERAAAAGVKPALLASIRRDQSLRALGMIPCP